MVKKLSSDPVKRRHQIFKRLYSYYYEWGALIEAGETDSFLTTPDGEVVYRGDLLVGFESLPEKQFLAFHLLCLEGMTESQAAELVSKTGRRPMPVQQHAEAGLRRMVKAYDEQQLGGYISPQRQKRRQDLIKRCGGVLKKLDSDNFSSLKTEGVSKLGSRQRFVLEELVVRGGYSRNCGWKFNSHSETVEVLDSLVARDLVVVTVVGDTLIYSLP